jgi:hypothetical protein
MSQSERGRPKVGWSEDYNPARRNGSNWTRNLLLEASFSNRRVKNSKPLSGGLGPRIHR